MRGLIIMAMFAVSLADAAWNNYQEQRGLNLGTAGIRSVDIEAGAGSLDVSGVKGTDAIDVEATIEVPGADAGTARDIIESDLQLKLEKQGDKAIVKAYFDDKIWHTGDSPRVHLTVRMPQNLDLVIEDGSGSLSVSDVSGAIDIDDGSGAIRLANVGGRVRVNDGSGSIYARDIGGDMAIEDGSGSIDVEGVAGTVTIDDGSGGIGVSRVRDDLIITESGSGGLKYSDVQGRVETDI